MNQLDFNLPEAIVRRDEGIRQVAENNTEFLKIARAVAKNQARLLGAITSDDVRRVCPVEPLHPNAYGAIFKTKDWEWQGYYRKSSLVQGHGNMQRVWKLRV